MFLFLKINQVNPVRLRITEDEVKQCNTRDSLYKLFEGKRKLFHENHFNARPSEREKHPGFLHNDFIINHNPIKVLNLSQEGPNKLKIYSCKENPFIRVPQGYTVLIPDNPEGIVEKTYYDWRSSPDLFTDEVYDCSILTGRAVDRYDENYTVLSHIFKDDIIGQVDQILENLTDKGLIGSEAIFSPRNDSFSGMDRHIIKIQNPESKAVDKKLNNFFSIVHTLERDCYVPKNPGENQCMALANKDGWYLHAPFDFKVQEKWLPLQTRVTGTLTG